MIVFLVNTLKIIFVLGFLVFIHEGGHFIVAKLCKVAVNEFSIGFGPIIWKKEGRQTKYSLRLIPLGGFVSLEGEIEDSQKESSFSKASIPKRMAIVLAGGIINILFGVLVYFTLMAIIGNNTSTIVEKTIENYAAQSVGIQENDKILKINGKKVNVKQDIDKIITKNNEEKLQITIERNGQIQNIELTPTKVSSKSTGIYLKSQTSGDSNKIIAVESKSIAEKVGIKTNDEILKINNKDVRNQTEIIQEIQNSTQDKIEFLIKRGNEELQIELIPDIIDNYYIGIYFKNVDKNIQNNLYYAIFKTRDFAISIIDNLKMLVTGNVKPEQMMGPVGISEVVFKTNNIEDFVYILALISLSLGVTNLLPIPALDGGKFLLLFIELIIKKKISQKVEINLQLIGFTLLIILSIYITYHDILRIL